MTYQISTDLATQIKQWIDSGRYTSEDDVLRGALDALRRDDQYQRDVQRCREEIQPALDRLSRGEGRPVDFDELEQQVTQRLADEGITDECPA